MRIDSTQPVRSVRDPGPATPRPGGEPAGAAKPLPDAEAAQAAVDRINQLLPGDLRASFHLVSDTHMVVVQLIDNQTGEVRRQFPPEWLVETAEQINKALGILLDKQA